MIRIKILKNMSESLKKKKESGLRDGMEHPQVTKLLSGQKFI